jgi:hypothetical protein
MGHPRLHGWPALPALCGGDGLREDVAQSSERVRRVLERRIDQPNKRWLLSCYLQWMLEDAAIVDMLDEEYSLSQV